MITDTLQGHIVDLSICAIIPARGGSKGIPRKNVRIIAGKPLVAHTIEQALAVTAIDRVVVSTDDREIAEISQEAGAGVVIRPPEISGDSASSEDALLHTLNYLRETEGYYPDIVVFLQCTSPLTRSEDIRGTINELVEKRADTALAVVPFHYFLWRKDDSGNAVGINHDQRHRLLRQESEPQFLEAGAVYVMRTRGFFKAQHRFFGKTVIYEMPVNRNLEIDDTIDLRIAEVLMRDLKQNERLMQLPDTISALVMDFDGVFTDNRVVVHQSGEESVLCDRSDGLGISRLRELGLPFLVLSSEQNSVVQTRCDKLGIQYKQGVQNKLAALTEWLNERNIHRSQVIYVGNDVNDIDCMTVVGCAIAVNDAYWEVMSAANIVLNSNGGYGAVREVCQMVLDQLSRQDQSS